MTAEGIISVKDISKNFLSTQALDNVSVNFRRGVVKGLIGENGSGKSTLANIISGVFPATSGTMTLQGQPYKPKSSFDAYQHKIGMITQEMGTIPSISVAENLFLGAEDQFRRGGLIDRASMRREAQEIFNSLRIPGIDPASLTGSYTLEERKLIEMARALRVEPDIFIVDETTTALTHTGRELLYSNIRRVKEKNGAVIFISHDIDELMMVCDEMTILRDGVFIAELQKDEFESEKIKELLVGRQLSENYYRADFEPSSRDEVVLKASNLHTMGGLKDVSLEVRGGEILGIGGLTDSGIHELGAALFGLVKVHGGEIRFGDGASLRGNRDALTHKMSYISKNRDQESIILDAPILDNIVIPSYKLLSRCGYIPRSAEKRLTNQQVESLQIKCRNVNQNVRELSGGNKQKVAFAKWLGNNAEIFILDCPTRGIDVGVKTSMYELMIQLKAEGKAIVLITEELPELIGMSDRILIMKNGRVQTQYSRSKDLSESYIIKDMI